MKMKHNGEGPHGDPSSYVPENRAIVKVKGAKKILETARERIESDAREAFVNETARLMKIRMILVQEFATKNKAIEIVDGQLQAIEEGRVRFDVIKNQIIFPKD